MLDHASLALRATFAVALAIQTSAAQVAPTLIDSHLAVDPGLSGAATMSTAPGVTALRAREAASGVDLNGDGDLVDEVAHLVFARNGSVRNMGHALATGVATGLSGRALAFVVDEAADSGADHNGDGDALDRVLFVHDFVSGTTTSTGFVQPFFFVVGERYLALLESEVTLGLGDVNGDGLIAQTVVLREHATGAVSYAGPSLVSLRAGAGRILWISDEAETGDLDGDGDAIGLQLIALDEATGVRFRMPTALGWAGDSSFIVRPEFAMFRVREADFAGDLNGDGDAADPLTALLVRGAPRPVFVQNAISSALGAESVVAFPVQEFVAGGDLNGDGDDFDAVLHVYDAEHATISSVGLAVRVHETRGLHAVVANGLVSFAVPESGQGSADLNGDGDVTDFVVHAYDTSTGLTRSSGLAVESTSNFTPIRSAASRVAFFVSEIAQGVDLNGNGTLGFYDQVAFDWLPRVPSSSPRNLGLSTSVIWLHALAVGRARVAVCAYEGTIDGNGDGDTNDQVVRTFDLATGVITETGFVVRDPPGPPQFLVEGGFAVFAVNEATSIGGDHTGDLDLLDDVPQVLRIDL